MNARSPINETPEPIVLSVAFNHDASRFICGMSDGVRSKHTQIHSQRRSIQLAIQLLSLRNTIVSVHPNSF